VLPLSARGFIRFDVEDFLTPESDDALLAMMESMRRVGLPGSYGLVGKKVSALKSRGRFEILARLREERSIGFHSTSHSEHPTLAEALAPLDYATARHHFVEREREGVEIVKQWVKAPQYFTQPGGNWVPEALEALPALGMDLFFTDSFNSYVVDLMEPYWYGDVMHLSFPVVNPRPFGLGLPHNLDEAIRLVDDHVRRWPDGMFMIMLHPTELVSTAFWDAVNYAQGSTRHPLTPAPLRSADDQRRALESFETYLEELSRLPVEWWDVATLKERVMPREPVLVLRQELEVQLRRHGWGPLTVTRGTLSAAEAVYALAKQEVTGAEAVTVHYVGPPAVYDDRAEEFDAMPSLEATQRFARAVVDGVERTGRLPSEPVAGLTWRAGMAGLVQEPLPLRFLSFIKEPGALHWDWPIFPKGFSPWRLWKDARRLAWTLKPARLTP
jgi:hypothetical protein